MTGENYKYEINGLLVKKSEIYNFIKNEREHDEEVYEFFENDNEEAVIHKDSNPNEFFHFDTNETNLFCLPKIKECKYEIDNDLKYGSTQFKFGRNYFYTLRIIGQTAKFKKFEYTVYKRSLGGLRHHVTEEFRRKYESYEDDNTQYSMVINDQYEIFNLNESFLRDEQYPDGISAHSYYSENC